MSKVVPGKFYVIDVFRVKPIPVSGPFDTSEEAEDDRLQLNIDGDCVVCEATEYLDAIRMKPIEAKGLQP